jgi:hypothetical protein
MDSQTINARCKERRCDVHTWYEMDKYRTVIQHGGGEALFSILDCERVTSSLQEIMQRYYEWVDKVHHYQDGFLQEE